MKTIEISRYLIARSDEVGDLMTNKKLQKLLYYVKAWGLVYFPDGVIAEPFEAWVHGPVCVGVYNAYKRFGYNPIRLDYPEGKTASDYIKDFKSQCRQASDIDFEKSEMIDAVFEKYGMLTSLQLELLTHSERPWIEARKGLSPVETGNRVIDEKVMKEYYSNKV